MNNSQRKATNTEKPERSVYTRKILRQILKNKQGNKEWCKYRQECYDNYEPCVDNEIFMYEEEVE